MMHPDIRGKVEREETGRERAQKCTETRDTSVSDETHHSL